MRFFYQNNVSLGLSNYRELNPDGEYYPMQLAIFRFSSLHKHLLASLLYVVCLLSSTIANAGTLVRINTPLGGFTLELFDDVAPNTVNNFLNYVNSGRYNGTIVHRSEVTPTPFVIQGGWLQFDEPSQNLAAIALDGAIQNEFSASNVRGTIAMAKVAGDPHSATSQWFVNLADNTFLDADNGGFTAFGRIVDNGMSVVDAIAALPRQSLHQQIPSAPVINFTGFPLKTANLVTVTMSVINNSTLHPNVFDTTSNLLYTKINAGSDGLVGLAFALHSLTPEVVIKALPSSLGVLSAPVANMATFDGSTGRVTIPEFIVNGEVAFRNVVFEVSNVEQLLFRLVSVQ